MELEHEVIEVIEELGQFELGCHRCEPVNDPIEIDLNPFSEDVVAHSHLQCLNRLNCQHFCPLAAALDLVQETGQDLVEACVPHLNTRECLIEQV